MHRRVARPGDRRRQYGHRCGDRRQAARGRIGDDRLPPLRGLDPRLRLRVRARQDRRRSLRVVRPADSHGRRRPTSHGRRVPKDRARRLRFADAAGSRPVPDSSFVLEADMVVKALGQEPLLDLLAALPELRCEKGVDRRRPRAPGPPASPASLPAATAFEAGVKSSTPSRTARSRPAGSMPHSHGRLDLSREQEPT